MAIAVRGTHGDHYYTRLNCIDNLIKLGTAFVPGSMVRELENVCSYVRVAV